MAALLALPVALVAGLVSFWALGGFHGGSPRPAASNPRPASTAPVSMPAPSLNRRQSTVCLALTSQLPAKLRDLPQRPVTAGAEQNAAYGDPPITVACGAGPRPSVPPDATVYRLSNVCWYPVERPDATVWTTLDREVPVTVTVPRQYDQAGQWVIEFSAPVVAAVPAIKDVPSGCHG